MGMLTSRGILSTMKPMKNGIPSDMARREKMKRLAFLVILLPTIFLGELAAGIKSLSQLYLLGGGLLDRDGDQLADTVALSLVIPDNPRPAEVVVAAEIAARANFESLAQDLAVVKKESDAAKPQPTTTFLFIGSNLRFFEKLRAAKFPLPALGPHQGVVLLLTDPGPSAIALLAGSDEALLKTGRAFFLRWPYLWEIWGREDGFTYQTVENDLANFWKEAGIPLPTTIIRAAFYEFPDLTSSSDSLRRLKFDAGEIAELRLECTFSDRKNREKATRALASLRNAQRHGQETHWLNYPGCRRLTFILKDGTTEDEISLPRLGFPKRLLTPAYRAPRKKPAQDKTFDLISLFSDKGLYADRDKDGLLDGLETSVIIPENLNALALAPLASRLVLPTAGASFPIIFFENEIELIHTVAAPCLIGDNRFTRELLKTGKLKLPSLAKNQAAVQVVSKPFNKTDSLAVVAADEEGLEKVLTYLARTFPYLESYGEENLGLTDVSEDLGKFLRGEGGAAEAFLRNKLESFAQKMKDKSLDYVQADFFLPEQNEKFVESVKASFEKSLKAEKMGFRLSSLRENKVILEKEKEFTWEVRDALSLLYDKIGNLSNAAPLSISLGVSESPAIRQQIQTDIEDTLRGAGWRAFEVEVLSAYKQGFFWLTEKILPRLRGRPVASLTVRFAEEKDDWTRPKRFYTEPIRWLQELYPVDEIFAAELGLPLNSIHFEMKSEGDPVYEFVALDHQGAVLLEASFSPRTRTIPFLNLLPEWGTVKVATGWLEVRQGHSSVLAALLPTDLEKVWGFYQEEVLKAVYAHVMKKTGHKPTTAKQPYFKRLLIELRASEPDFRLGVDEEIVSSLEAMHDELYFDTLDFLRGITDIELEETDLPEDTSRLSAPGNIFPLVHPSTEGRSASCRAILEDWSASTPRLVLRWKEKGRDFEESEEENFPPLKPKAIRYPAFVYDGNQDRIENLVVELEFEKETDYLTALEIIQTVKDLEKGHLIKTVFAYPRLKFLTLRLKHKDFEKEEVLVVSSKLIKKKGRLGRHPGQVGVSTDEIISPEKCLDIVHSLGSYPMLKAYIGGISYENREIPVIEAFLPQGEYVSLPRLITFKPTLFLSGRQHANEVSSTNYILKLAELLATQAAYQNALQRINFVLLPLENPDGASLAFELQKLTPFHSLHAGRYSALGVDIGSQVGLAKPFLPEAMVRKNLQERWLPDIYLNLHGYPSHEWVQAFSGYSPYLFRDYWIPRGWFAYFRAPRLPIYEKNRQAADDLRRFLISEMQADEQIRKSNEKFYSRYRRWASRWQPHLNELELHDGLNLYIARRSSQETKLTPRSKTTYVEETPELMDETARGAWLDFLCQQGLTYLQAHIKYLSQVHFEISRIEEETESRITLELSRSRPGRLKKSE